jgi:glycosyltransferase involved in cell wall biosynthesis
MEISGCSKKTLSKLLIMSVVVQKNKVCLLLIHNRHNSGLYDYCEIYNKAYSNSKIELLSDLYPYKSQWIIFLFFFLYKKRINVQIKKQLKNYDIVHICDNPIYSLSILKLFEKNSINTIFTLHDPKSHISNKIKLKIKNWFSNNNSKRIYKFISKSSSIKLHIHYKWDIPYLNNPIIQPHPHYPIENNKQKELNDSLTIGFVGRLEYYKGFDIFIRIIKQLDQFVQHKQVNVVIAGGGQINEEIELKNINLKLYNKFIESDSFDSLIQSIDIILLPYREASQSGVLMKAITYDIPVILNDLDELTCYINSDTGCIIPISEEKMWVEKLLYFVQNKHEINKMSKNISKQKYIYNPEFIANELYR